MKDLSILTDLISIRNYVSLSINNFSLKREDINKLNTTLIMLDKLIVSKLFSDEFKKLINFDNAKDAIQEVINTNNIRVGMNASEKVVTINDGKPEIGTTELK